MRSESRDGGTDLAATVGGFALGRAIAGGLLGGALRVETGGALGATIRIAGGGLLGGTTRADITGCTERGAIVGPIAPLSFGDDGGPFGAAGGPGCPTGG